MAHFSENSKRLELRTIKTASCDELFAATNGCNEVCILRLPASVDGEPQHRLQGFEQTLARVAKNLGSQATLLILCEVIDLVKVHQVVSPYVRYQSWIALKKEAPVPTPNILPQHHFGAVVYTKYQASLRHAKTRIAYTYCPACDRTTKDYGGKKHTYHEYGTLMSDVWRDIPCDFADEISPVIERFADLFGIEPYKELRLVDCRKLFPNRRVMPSPRFDAETSQTIPASSTNQLILGDCLQELKRLPDNSIDFAFADPPYHVGKTYTGYADDLQISEYFNWCDEWIRELARVLKPGRTCALLNIPLWAIRHFLCMEKHLEFQSWIVWDALSFPVRMIMPAHYAILCFSKGMARQLPETTENFQENGYTGNANPLEPLAEGFCLRSQCMMKRNALRLTDRARLTDVWWDIHRLKHNTRRVDHPCQLPPQLLYRLITLFTQPDELVLDCFNGAGTTTLAAQQLSRRYIGIEKSDDYHKLAQARHEELLSGLDPFRKEERRLSAKNSPVPRMPKQKYAISKKALQLEVKRIATILGKLPTRSEMQAQGKYPIEYYDKYFVSWGEVCAAARTTGMTETRRPELPLFGFLDDTGSIE